MRTTQILFTLAALFVAQAATAQSTSQTTPAAAGVNIPSAGVKRTNGTAAASSAGTKRTLGSQDATRSNGTAASTGTTRSYGTTAASSAGTQRTSGTNSATGSKRSRASATASSPANKNRTRGSGGS